MPKIDLMPCPFCGKPDTAIIITVAECECMDNPTEWDKTHYGVVCDNSIEGGCGASTGWNHETPEEAVQEWNTRASGWIPCSEKMPDDNVDVLVYDDCVLIARYNTYDKYEIGWMETFECYPLTNVTHWMPLPKTPQRKDDTHDND